MDTKRINSYYDEIIGFKIDDEHYFSLWPKWVGNLTISGSAPSKPVYSPYEKAVTVTEYIKSSNQFLPKRHAPFPLCKKDFVYYEETVTARRITIRDKLSLWIAENTDIDSSSEHLKYGHLILIEDHRKADGDIKFLGGSTHGLLVSHGFSLKLSESENQAFSLNPIELLKTKDYLVSDPQRITVLYRLIDWSRDLVNDRRISTLGYPILISE